MAVVYKMLMVLVRFPKIFFWFRHFVCLIESVSLLVLRGTDLERYDILKITFHHHAACIQMRKVVLDFLCCLVFFIKWHVVSGELNICPVSLLFGHNLLVGCHCCVTLRLTNTS